MYSPAGRASKKKLVALSRVSSYQARPRFQRQPEPRLRLEAGGAGIAEVDVLRGLPRAHGELHLHLVARLEDGALGERPQHPVIPAPVAQEVAARDVEEVAAPLGRQLLGREVPGRGANRKPGVSFSTTTSE